MHSDVTSLKKQLETAEQKRKSAENDKAQVVLKNLSTTTCMVAVQQELETVLKERAAALVHARNQDRKIKVQGNLIGALRKQVINDEATIVALENDIDHMDRIIRGLGTEILSHHRELESKVPDLGLVKSEHEGLNTQAKPGRLMGPSSEGVMEGDLRIVGRCDSITQILDDQSKQHMEHMGEIVDTKVTESVMGVVDRNENWVVKESGCVPTKD